MAQLKENSTVGGSLILTYNDIERIGIEWLGELSDYPASPVLKQAFYHTVNKIAYIYDGSTWETLAADGSPGIASAWSAGTYYTGSVVTHNGFLWENITDTTGEPGVVSDWRQISTIGTAISFSAWLTTENTSTGTMIFNGVAVNNSSAYKYTTGVFTAPVTGTYEFTATAIASTTSGSSISWMKNGAYLTSADIISGSPNSTSFQISVPANTGGPASNTIYLNLDVNDQITLYHNDTNGIASDKSTFSGRLVQGTIAGQDGIALEWSAGTWPDRSIVTYNNVFYQANVETTDTPSSVSDDWNIITFLDSDIRLHYRTVDTSAAIYLSSTAINIPWGGTAVDETWGTAFGTWDINSEVFTFSESGTYSICSNIQTESLNTDAIRTSAAFKIELNGVEVIGNAYNYLRETDPGGYGTQLYQEVVIDAVAGDYISTEASISAGSDTGDIQVTTTGGFIKIHKLNPTTGPAGKSINWLGSSASDPADPQTLDVYFNTTDKFSYIYNGSTWDILTNSPRWLGSSASDPSTPDLLNFYYNTTTNKTYVYNGSTWDTFSESINWLGELAADPGSPVFLSAYYNTTDGTSYIYNGSTWDVLVRNINWLGELSTAPVSPAVLDTYYDTTDSKAYIYNGASWDIFSESINWLGELASAPGTATLLDAYYDTTMNAARIYNGSTWDILVNGYNYGYYATTSSYTITDVDGISVIEVTTGANDVTITLPTLADNRSREITIMKLDSGIGTVIIDGEGAETINGSATLVLDTQYLSAILHAVDNDWIVKNTDVLPQYTGATVFTGIITAESGINIGNDPTGILTFSSDVASFAYSSTAGEDSGVVCAGDFSARQVWNAAWNDIAEFMYYKTQSEPGDVVIMTDEGCIPSNKIASRAAVGVHSDTFGYALGSAEKKLKTPIGLTGRVWVKVKEKLKIGDYLVSGLDGFATKKRWWHPREAIIGKVMKSKKNTEIERIETLIK